MKIILVGLMLFFSIYGVAQVEEFNSEAYSVLNKDSLEYIPWTVKDFNSIVLTKKEIVQADSLFINYCNKTNNGDSTVQATGKIGLMNYKRQYLPLANSKEEKLVWINCFCEKGSNLPHFSSNNPNMWKKEVIVVKDGGNCYFSVLLNLNTREFSKLMVNGM